MIVQALQKDDPSCQKFGNLIEASRTMLHSFQSWSVMHIRRDANQTAHMLAKAALQTPVETIWMEEYRAFFNDIVLSDHCNS